MHPLHTSLRCLQGHGASLARRGVGVGVAGGGAPTLLVDPALQCTLFLGSNRPVAETREDSLPILGSSKSIPAPGSREFGGRGLGGQ